MARRGPFERGLLLPGDRGKRLGLELGDHALHELQREPDIQVGMPAKRLERLRPRRFTVHQHQRKPHVVALTQRHQLTDDDVQKAVALPRLEQRFGMAQPHRRGETAVQLDRHDTL